MNGTMTHIDEGRLQGFLDGELHLDERRRTELHLQGCSLCQAELEEMRGRAAHFSAAMEVLDRAPRGREHAVGWPQRSRWTAARRYLPRAAVLLLFAGAAASATVPGSPVRGWLEELAGSESAAPAPEGAAEAPQRGVAAVAERAEAGVSVAPVNGSVQVLVRGAAGVQVRAALVEGRHAGVYAFGEAADTRFLTGPGRIEVIGAAAGELRIEIPRAATTASIRINEREVLRKNNGELNLGVSDPALESAGVTFSVEP